MSDLLFAEIAGFWADGQKRFVVVVTFLAFIDVGYLVGEVVRAEFNRDGIGDELQCCFGLGVVPDVGKSSPTGLRVDEQTRLDEFLGIAGREGERFRENCADGKFESIVVAILG